MMRRLIRTDGSFLDFVDPVPSDRIGELIGADTTDTVILRHMGQPLHVMVLDDQGYETEALEHDGYTEMRPIRARKPVNAEATRLYHANCMSGTTHQIVGDVMVVPDQDYAP